jgi:hypothetical protein
MLPNNPYEEYIIEKDKIISNQVDVKNEKGTLK